MRISSIKDDPGYVPHIGRYVVMLDGKRVHNLLTADDTKGEVLVYSRDKNGDMVIGMGGRLATHPHTGFVQIWDRLDTSEHGLKQAMWAKVLGEF